MNGTFHIIQDGGEEMWLDGDVIERLTKYEQEGDVSRHFNVEVVRKCAGIGFVQSPEVITCVAAIVFYPNIKEKQEL